ncbi:MAG TPA: hypothetical protein VH880_03610 [Anaeromyxobacteraceae bacterium]
MDLKLAVGIWECDPDDRPGADAALARGAAAPPDFQAAIVAEQGDVLALRVEDGAVPSAGPVYLVEGRGLYQESKRVEWLSISGARRRFLLTLKAI